MSNFLQVPSQRRASFKGWDSLESENSKDSPEDEAHSSKDGEENKRESDKYRLRGRKDTLEEKDFYLNLIQKAPFIPGDAGELVTFEEIPWVDQSLIQDSVAFHKKYFAHELFSIIVAIIFSFAIKPISAVTLRARQGRATDSEEFYERHISTIQRITKFFDFHKNPDEAYDEILKIRKMHTEAITVIRPGSPDHREDLKLDEPWKKEMVAAIQKDLEFVDTCEAPKEDVLSWEPAVLMSQFDMVTNQLGFWIHMWLYPRFFGITNRNKEMKGILHVWAIFGRLLGIQDEYNVCLQNPERPPKNPDLYEKLYRCVMLESLKNIDETVITIQDTFMAAFRQRVPFVTYKAIVYFGLQEIEGYTGDNLWKAMTWKDKMSVRFLQGFFLLMRRSQYFKLSVNYILYYWFQLQFFLYLPFKQWKRLIPKYLKNSITLKLY